jgi:CubicO group peptidase (beta-lactamase class C family)
MLDGLAEFCGQTLAACGSASVSVAVAHRDTVVFAEAFGLADITGGRPATSETAYLLASLTKPVTAAAVAAAVTGGLLDLDEPIENYLGGLRLARHRDYAAPTVRQVLQHRAGLGTHYDFRYADSPAIMPTAREAIERYGTLYREPGSRFEYSNLGYGLLDLALRTATGRDPGEFTRDQVLGPLGLTSYHLGPSYPGPGPAALRYAADGRQYPLCDTSHRGASLGWATAPDLAMFGLSQGGGAGIAGPAAPAVVRAALPTDDPRLGYGLGWFVSASDRHPVLSHSGSMGGVANMLLVVPGRELSVCVLTNQTGTAARSAIVGRVMTELMPDFALASLPPAVGAERAMTIQPGTWAGRIHSYAGPVPLVLRILPDARAQIRLDGGEPAHADLVGASAHWDLRIGAPVQLPVPDARVNSPRLGLELSAAGGGLTGAARAYKDGEDGGWLGNLFSYWCELTPAP